MLLCSMGSLLSISHDCCLCCRNQAQEHASKLQMDLAEKAAGLEEVTSDLDKANADRYLKPLVVDLQCQDGSHYSTLQDTWLSA